MKTYAKKTFIYKYISHCWRCYKTVTAVAKRLDVVMDKLYCK